jgi:hypothetical protein
MQFSITCSSSSGPVHAVVTYRKRYHNVEATFFVRALNPVNPHLLMQGAAPTWPGNKVWVALFAVFPRCAIQCFCLFGQLCAEDVFAVVGFATA